MSPRTPLTWSCNDVRALDARVSWRDDWNALNARSLDLPFMDASAMMAALSAFGTGRERLHRAHRGGQLVAMAILTPRGLGRWGTFQPSQMPLGALLLDRGENLDDIAPSLLRSAPWPTLALSLTQWDPLAGAPPVDAPTLRVAPYIDTAWVELEGSFDDYWATRGKNLRANLRKQRNKLAAEGIAPGLVSFDRPEDMAGAVARYGCIESAGWKAERGTAIHPDNVQGRFYRELLESAAQRGEAVVYEYRFNERPVAMHLCLRRGSQLVILKTTYDETVDKSLSPAQLLHHDELQSLFVAGTCRRVEYYGRVMEWHTRWTDRQRGLVHLTCYRWPWLRKRLQPKPPAPPATPAGTLEPPAPAAKPKRSTQAA